MKFELTEIEKACGVTTADVQRYLPLGLFFDADTAFALPSDTPPAIGAATARCAFGRRAVYVGLNTFGHVVYRPIYESEDI